jgi:CRISPR-associated protein Cmr4
MNVWKKTTLFGLYTLTPMHFGTGQTAGAVDLPIARDSSTGFPVLPATGIKGALRDYLERLKQVESSAIECLFGKELDPEAKAESIRAGLLAFTEARLLAYPVRSLNRPFLHVTCPLIMERFARDVIALGRGDFLPDGWSIPALGESEALAADDSLAESTLVLEDLAFERARIKADNRIKEISKALCTLLPEEEENTRDRLSNGLIFIPDRYFAYLMQYVVPVQARIKLTAGKTTDTWTNPDTGETESGNLWYEENLPSDCLFMGFMGERRQRKTSRDTSSTPEMGIENLLRVKEELKVVQLGGNETVGHGLCFCTLHSMPPKEESLS